MWRKNNGIPKLFTRISHEIDGCVPKIELVIENKGCVPKKRVLTMF